MNLRRPSQGLASLYSHPPYNLILKAGGIDAVHGHLHDIAAYCYTVRPNWRRTAMYEARTESDWYRNGESLLVEVYNFTPENLALSDSYRRAQLTPPDGLMADLVCGSQGCSCDPTTPAQSLMHRAMLMTLYGIGVRRAELCQLKVKLLAVLTVKSPRLTRARFQKWSGGRRGRLSL